MIDKPWVKKYDAEVPACLEYPAFCIQDFLIEQAQKNPNRIALYCEGRKITYRDLLRDSQCFAEKLLKMGLNPNDRVAIALPNTIEFVTAYYGSLLAGGIVAAMNPAYPLPEWQYQANIVKPAVLIGPAKRMDDLQSLQKSGNIRNLVIVRFGKNDPAVRVEGTCVFYDSMLHDSSEKPLLPEIKPNDAALLQFSGGTTGQPKAALALHRNVAANIIQFSRWLTTMISEEEVFLTMIPLYHVYGMVIGLNVGIAMGASIVLVPDGRDLEKVLQLVPKYKVTFFPGVPSVYQAINHNQKVMAGKINLKSIKACISGSAPLAAETRIQFESVSGAKLVEGYGLSEAPTATHCNPIKGENRLGSIGLPLPDVECRIIDLKDSKTDLPVGETGELLIRSPQIMQEYFENRDETNIALKNGWLHTGDIARMDGDGYFYIVGRRKELIKVNGLQVWPIEVEKVIRQFHGIIDVVVAGIPDEDTGEAIKAWLVLEDPDDFNENDLLDFCRRFLAGYKVPKDVEIVTDFPRSAVGKVLRRKLVEGEMKKKSGA